MSQLQISPEFHFVAFFLNALNPVLRPAGLLVLALTGVGDFQSCGLLMLFVLFFWNSTFMCLDRIFKCLIHPYKGGSSSGWSFTLHLPSQYKHLPVLALHYGFTYGKPDLTILALQVLAKSRVRGQLIYEKLDRAIGRHDWHNLYPASSITYDPFICSDHYFLPRDLPQSINNPPSDSNKVGPNMNKSILLSNNNVCFVLRNNLNSSNGISKHGEPTLEIILRPRLTKIRPK
ncbi:hypothetical protein Cgig2_006619 [Carnegiea gigantea]|uniref:Uncharacterized protein n=1 Tax=Carnegiea gigantea TaxID=171969 RepID=A0A9Q1GSV6_9CARY|nr:hypothetical protein Cgig2_006619 [Carnegiea gigantea]